jgi:HEPN domain-containing protein
MTPDKLRRDEVDRWLALAAKDLHAALLLVLEEPSASVFHSQQCAEKSEKALLTFHNTTFRKTHDLTELGKQCALLAPDLTPLLNKTAHLTEYAIVFRYTDAPREPDAAEAEAAMTTARSLYDRISELLSPEQAQETDACNG